MAVYDYEIGANIGAMTNVEDLVGCPPHPTSYRDGATQQYIAEWRFKYLSATNYAILKAWFGTAQSVARGIKTKDTGGTYVTKTCIMHKPVMGRDVTLGHYGYYSIKLRFTQLT